MSNPYAAIFRPAGAKGFALAGFFARVPMAMAPIGMVAMLSQTHGEYWLAGAVSATYALTNALLSPQISRIIDRKGQARVLLPTTLASILAFIVLVTAANQGWPTWTLFAAAILAALMPSFPAMLRARWGELFRDRPELNTAFAFESAADELVYVAGASLSVGLSVALFPEAGLILSTALLTVGGLAFIAQRKTEPAVRTGADISTQSAFWLRPVQVLTLALVFIGAIFATAEVSTVAITEALGQPEAASLVISVYALGSFVLGLVVGALNLQFPLQRQLAVAVSVIAVTTVPLLLVDTVPWLALAVFVSGIAISPTFITTFGLVERLVPQSMLTEAITWVMTGIGIGTALGSFVSGWVVDTFGAGNGFWVSVAAGALALTTVLAGQTVLGGGRASLQPAE
jgi:MFS family permease